MGIKLVVFAVTLANVVFGLQTQAQQAPIAASLGQAQEQFADLLKKTLACPLVIDSAALQSKAQSVSKSLNGETSRVGKLALQDLQKMKTYCASEAYKQDLQALAQLQNNIRLMLGASSLNWIYSLGTDLANTNKNPAAILNNFVYVDGKQEWNLEARAQAAFLSAKAPSACPAAGPTTAALHDASIWQSYLLQNGYVCTASEYKRLSQMKNTENNKAAAQNFFADTEGLTLDQLIAKVQMLYAKELNEGNANIAFIPHLSYEEAQLEQLFPYKLFDKSKGELELYPYFQKKLRALGFNVSILDRDSVTTLDKQVNKTIAGILALPEDHKYIMISRSMGSMVMNAIKKRAEEMHDPKAILAMKRIDSWLGVGGTPRGSVIAEYKGRPDVFYRSIFPRLAGLAQLPLDLLKLDPRITGDMSESLSEGMLRSNLDTTSFKSNAAKWTPAEATSHLPIMNVVFLTSDFHRATNNVDIVYSDMMMYGPTEGSSRLVDAAVDSQNSARIFYKLDHLAFWVLQPIDAFGLYLRILIAAKESEITYAN